MEYVVIGVILAIILAAGGYLEHKFGSKVAADVASVKNDVAELHDKVDAVKIAVEKK
jgi:outer membrane murein-binding lipoprotein Lpp